MTAEQRIDLAIVVAAVLILAWVTISAVTDRMRERRPIRTGRDLAALLEEPVRMPHGHPETWPEAEDEVDVLLAEWHDVAWPSEQWLAVLDCPKPHLTGYDTDAQALVGELPRPGRIRLIDCRCGRVHVRHRRPVRLPLARAAKGAGRG